MPRDPVYVGSLSPLVKLTRNCEEQSMRTSVRCAVILLSLLLSWFAAAQSTTSLRGVVSDAGGADGVYQFLQLPPATYAMTVTSKGFASITRANLTLLVNSPATLNFTMK